MANNAATITMNMREADRLETVQSDRGPRQPSRSSYFFVCRLRSPDPASITSAMGLVPTDAHP
jgi:hypothetical protein